MNRRIVVLGTLAVLPLLQACFPLAVTGMGAATLMATDRRTAGTYIEDETIEWKSVARLREICRARELLLDFLVGPNQYNSSEAALQRYFDAFGVAAVNGRSRNQARSGS